MKLKWLSNLSKFINQFSVPSVTKIWKKYKRLSLVSPINDKLASEQKRKVYSGGQCSIPTTQDRKDPINLSNKLSLIVYMPLVHLSSTVLQKIGRTVPRASTFKEKSKERSHI